MFDKEAAVKSIQASRCPCARCTGGLTDPKLSPGGWGHCRSCRCAWQVQVNRMDKVSYAVSIPGQDCPSRR